MMMDLQKRRKVERHIFGQTIRGIGYSLQVMLILYWEMWVF